MMRLVGRGRRGNDGGLGADYRLREVGGAHFRPVFRFEQGACALLFDRWFFPYSGWAMEFVAQNCGLHYHRTFEQVGLCKKCMYCR